MRILMLNAAAGLRTARRTRLLPLVGLGLALSLGTMPAWAQNPVVGENSVAHQGTWRPPAVWDISGHGDDSIQGFATDISVNKGETVAFKIQTDAASYTIAIYRLGYYEGNGARLVDSLGTIAGPSNDGVAPTYDQATGLTDCGNWAVSASWDVPAGAVSGIYVAKLTRLDTHGASHIAFIVRDDASHSDLLFQTSDATWQAYNTYGGNSLYVAGANPPPPFSHAVKVSYNRPFVTRSSPTEDWLFNAEYPMVRWLEANGYDVTYSTNVDTERHGSLILNHKVFLSVGHDEYWSGGMRTYAEAARNAGVHLAFFSGNEIYWKTRWEPSPAEGYPSDPNRGYRTLVCYKEGTLGEYNCGGICDPTNVWTGLWRDGCGATPQDPPQKSDACRPENALAGNISWMGTTGAIQVPQEYGSLRFWRNTSVASLAPGQVALLPYGTLGYEWDPQQYDAYYPPGRIRLSSTSYSGRLHHLSLCRHVSSGALVFSAGSVQWSWGLDSNHDRGSAAPDPRMQQASVNLFADMDAQPGTLQPGLVPATKSTDLQAPTSSIDAPQNGSTVKINTGVTITGTALDAGGGVVGALEVSVDGGATWQAATGRESWSYVWTPAAYGAVNIKSRSVDDSGNLETPGSGVTVTVGDVNSGPPNTPVANGDYYTTDRNVPITIAAPGVLGNDTDPNSEALTAELRNTTAHGILALNSDGSFTYTPALDFAGNDPFTYRARNAVSGNLSNPATAWISVAQTCPCTIFEPQSAPLSPYENDLQPLDLGVKFKSDVDGYVTGVRFYKQTQNTGAHRARLWDAATQTELANEPFTGETASGWQQVDFAAPVAITAGHVYIATYHTSTGYAQDTYAFTAYGKDNPPLHALVDGESGPNGVYAYGAGGVFPTAGYNSSNYYVDVVFNTTVGPDETPPQVTARSPGNGASGVAIGTSVTATFNEAIDPATVTTATFELRDPGDALVLASVSYSSAAHAATLAPNAPLAYLTVYTATLKGGSAGIKDVAGNALAADQSWPFTTAAQPPPPPDEGSGGPILVVASAANPFGRYYAEILRTEGLNEFRVKDISLVTPAVLDSHEVVILGEMPLSAGQVTMLTDWVTAGGNLIAMRPDKQLAGLLGLTDAADTLSNKYLLVNTASGPGMGIVNQTIQFHSKADRYTLSGATALATLYSDATTPTSNPAVTLRSIGTSGGQAAAFTYDLARSVVYTHQGNPGWAGWERDGVGPLRSDDMFYGNAAGDPQPDWIDLTKVAIPQADEQQRLLANMVLSMNRDRKPLPRFWYFPRGLKAVVIMTGDDHGSSGEVTRFENNKARDPVGCSVDDWECVRSSMYNYPGGGFSDAQAASYTSQGFEVGRHVDTGCGNWTPASLEATYASQLANFAATYPSVPGQSSHRTHCIAWSDWATQPEVEAAHGIRLDVNYYYWPPAWVAGRSGMFTGSGMPMRFARLDGSMIDCYQSNTELPDESGFSFPAAIDALLDKAVGPEGYYGAFTMNMHAGSEGACNAIITSAQSRGVAVVSGRQMLTWLDGRNGSMFQSLAWSDNVLSFSIAVAAGARNLQAMLPTLAAVGQLTGITRGGSPISYTTQTIKGVEYAFFPAEAGSYAAQYLVDSTPPVITSVVATPHDDGTATVTWTTNEASDSRVDYGTAPDALAQNVSSGDLVTFHSLSLTGLAPNTRYCYRVSSTDAASNTATQPVAPGTLEFVTPPPVCFLDATAARFALGTTGTGTYLATLGDGEVILAPTAASEFEGSALSPGWSDTLWAVGGLATVGGGTVTLDGAMIRTTTLYGAGRSLEFIARFTGTANEHIGFGTNLSGPPWAIFSSYQGGGLYARTNSGSVTDTPIPGSWFGAPHRFRIEWNSSSVVFYVDGAQVASHAVTIAANMRVLASDLTVGGTAVTVDWMHMSPYAASGSFTSRVYDAAGTANWGTASWTAQTPPGTSVALATRQGSTTPPDETWTAYTEVLSNGGTIGGSSRYIQYRADLATTASASTPVLDDVHITCSTGPDSTPPVIASVTATPGGDGTSAVIAWSTNEPADSRVDYGTAPGSLTQSASNASLVGSHSLTLTGLTPLTTYYYRVTSADAAHNTASAPVEPDLLSFQSTAGPCAADRTAADFGAGTFDAGTYLTETADGEVVLRPTEGAEFSGSALPAGWSSATYDPSGSATVSGGLLRVDGAHANTDALHAAGRSLEFVATFDATAVKQHAGFGNTLNEAPWAIFSTGLSGGTLLARTWDGTTMDDFAVPGAYLGAPHRYRIDWGTGAVDFYVDGVIKYSHSVSIAGPMRPIAGDGQVDATALVVDWMRMTPYAASGTFTSRVLDAGGSAKWNAFTWSSDLPASTGLAVAARLGNTPAPDATWTPFMPVASSGGTVPGHSRYVQYRASLTTTNPRATPALLDLSVACTQEEDTAAPVITGVTATPAPSGESATVSWTTDEPATSRVDYGTDPEALNQSVSDPALVLTRSITLPGLSPATVYYYQVVSADLALNTATSPMPPAPPNTFVTSAPTCFVDQTAADFGAGNPGSGTYVAVIGDGDVILKPAAGAEFSGTSLPPDWNTLLWTGDGSATVSGGWVTVDGARINPTDLTGYGPGVSLEFVAVFRAAALQHVGLGAGTNGNAGGIFNTYPWAIFGTGTAGTSMLARTNVGGTMTDVTIPGNFFGVPHRYRVDWKTGSVDFFIDDTLRNTQNVTITGGMRPAAADYYTGGLALSVDWMRMTPYAASSGTFESRVFDAGGNRAWATASWTSILPAGTGLTLSVRKGNTPGPGAYWTAYSALPGSGATVGGQSRYIQYKADLTTGDLAVTPRLESVVIECVSTPDLTPPTIANVAATLGGDGVSATITWDTDEMATSRVDYGTASGALTSHVDDPSLVAAHSIVLTGLGVATSYYFRVTSVDGSSNSATYPVPPAAPLSFATPAAPCPADATVADFGAGTLDANTYISPLVDGEVILKPAEVAEFSGSSLPPGWTVSPWPGGGTATVSGGLLTVAGAITESPNARGSDVSVEFVATFGAEASQHVGFESGSGGFGRYAMFSTGGSTNAVYARASDGGVQVGGPELIGAPHRYRIVWNTSSIEYYVDDVLKVTRSVTVAGPLYPMASDYYPASPSLTVDWMRIGPYPSAGSFTSRVFDDGGPTNWGTVSWNGSLPSGTSLTVNVRGGDTGTPDGTWTEFFSVANGASAGFNSRYVQYRADLAAGSPAGTPALQDIAVACVAGPDLTPPVISSVTATPAPNGQSATVTWATNEPSNSRVNYGTSPGALTLNVSATTRVRSHSLPLTGLTPGTTYYYRVTSADGAGNSATEPSPPASPLSFITPAPVCFLDQTATDFSAGLAGTGTYVSQTADGEVILAPTLGNEFSGTSLPADWTSVAWNTGGTSTVSGGGVAVDGARLTPLSTTGYSAGRMLEFIATFRGAQYQNAGLGGGDNSLGPSGMYATGAQPWAMFGTAGTTTTLYARLNPGSDIALGTGYLNAPHLYRIEWRADSVVFLIDGASVNRRAASLTTPMRPGISDYNVGGLALSVDWIRLTPYASAGTFRSRVYDGGEQKSWISMSWNATVLAGTGLGMFARGGNVPDTTDASWSAWMSIASSGAGVGICSRYVQYRADFSTSTVGVTPVLRDVSLTCAPAGAPGPPVTDLASAPPSSGQDASGRLKLAVNWSGGGGGGAVKVYRKGYGGYPQYAVGVTWPPEAPASPGAAEGAGWALTQVAASGDVDQPPTRDYWAYVLFQVNACGQSSAPSNVTSGTLDYVLGDVHTGADSCAGDNAVTMSDVSFLGAHYAMTMSGPADPYACLDVGPTTDYSTTGRPVPDGVVEFEDLVMFALNYGTPTQLVIEQRPQAASANSVGLVAPAPPGVGEEFEAALVMSGAGDIVGLSVQLGYDPAVVEPVAVTGGALLAAQGAPSVVLSSRPGNVDVALLAGGSGIAGEGEVARVRLRMKAAGDPGLRLDRIEARNGRNEPVAMGAVSVPAPAVPAAAAPARTYLGPRYPDPFSGRVVIRFGLHAPGLVRLSVYDVQGRRVRGLVSSWQPSGEHQAVWDGQDESGSPVAAGVYLVRLTADGRVMNGSVRRVR